MARALSFLIRYFSNYYTLHRSDLAAQAAPLDPRLNTMVFFLLKPVEFLCQPSLPTPISLFFIPTELANLLPVNYKIEQYFITSERTKCNR